MKLYLSGPITSAPDTYEYDFDAGAKWLRAKGHEVVNPVELDDPDESAQYFSDGCPTEQWHGFLRRDIAQLVTCDAVAVLPGWEESKGARLEVDLARGLGMLVLDAWTLEPVHPLSVALGTESDPNETRIINAATGGEKGQKLQRFDLLPAGPLTQIAEHFGRGARKYADRNWERGYDWSLSFGALQRHLWQWWGGEDLDAETGSSHLAAAGFHVLALLQFIESHPALDDRPTTIRPAQ